MRRAAGMLAPFAAGRGSLRVIGALLAVHATDFATAASPPSPAPSGWVVGEFRLPPNAVLDGDTLRVTGLDAPVRLLAVDTEETFKTEAERRAYRRGWDAYRTSRGGKSPRPVSYPTPLGEEAARFAKVFFSGVEVVRLERDHPAERRDYFGRHLAYVFALKDGRWVHFNLECVRSGMSPYFQKYGRSRRFHDDFVEAQREARNARRGVWDPAGEHYGDYETRLNSWDSRAEALRRFEAEARGRDDHVVLTHEDALRRLERLVGREVTVFGTVSEIRRSERGPTLVLLGRRKDRDFPLVFPEREVFLASNVSRQLGEYVLARGILQRRRRASRGTVALQIVVRSPLEVRSGSPSGAGGPLPPQPRREVQPSD